MTDVDGDRRWEVLLDTSAEVESRLPRMRVRDGTYLRYEVSDAALAVPVLGRLPLAQRLVVAAGSGPVLWSALSTCLGPEPSVLAMARYLREGFPPEGRIQAVTPAVRAAVWDLAQGAPGETVAHGLFPGRATKLARLALARWAEYPADVVLRAAERAYGPDRTDYQRSYYAHDALACALVHPYVDATELAAPLRVHHGWRSRRKRHRLLEWARRHGYLQPDVGR